jgi:hypothetical protein
MPRKYALLIAEGFPTLNGLYGLAASLFAEIFDLPMPPTQSLPPLSAEKTVPGKEDAPSSSMRSSMAPVTLGAEIDGGEVTVLVHSATEEAD